MDALEVVHAGARSQASDASIHHRAAALRTACPGRGTPVGKIRNVGFDLYVTADCAVKVSWTVMQTLVFHALSMTDSDNER